MTRPAAHLAALFACVALASCTKPQPQPPPPLPPAPAPPVPPPPRAALSPELAGAKVEERRDGPWTVRSARPGGGGGPGAPAALAPASRSLAAPAAARGEASSAAEDASAAPGEPAPAPAKSVAFAARAPGAAPASPAAPAAPEEAAREGRPGAAEAEDLSVVEGLRVTAAEPAEAGPPLRAGSTDDNPDLAAFLAYLERAHADPATAANSRRIDVAGRRLIRIVDRSGRPVPAARVSVTDVARDKLLWTATTLGDGRAPFYPAIAAAAAATAGNTSADHQGPAAWTVQATAGGLTRRVSWDGQGEELVVALDGAVPAADPVRLDVCFLIDTTGSMGDEIAAIKSTLLSVTKRLRSLSREFDLRYGAVLYRDLGDDYVTRAHPFTADIEAFDEALKGVQAGGGGDGPESLNQGLAVAVDRMDWRDGAARVAFLIADAPPHMDYAGDTPYAQSLVAAVAGGIRIHSVAASGLDAAGTLVFRQVAQLTRGKFIFIEYGDLARTAESHGLKGKVSGNNLDDIIYEQIRDEVAGWGRG